MLLFLALYQVCANQTAKNLVLFTSPRYMTVTKGETLRPYLTVRILVEEVVCETQVLEPQ